MPEVPTIPCKQCLPGVANFDKVMMIWKNTTTHKKNRFFTKEFKRCDIHVYIYFFYKIRLDVAAELWTSPNPHCRIGCNISKTLW